MLNERIRTLRSRFNPRPITILQDEQKLEEAVPKFIGTKQNYFINSDWYERNLEAYIDWLRKSLSRGKLH